jgi:hypothetical protein
VTGLIVHGNIKIAIKVKGCKSIIFRENTFDDINASVLKYQDSTAKIDTCRFINSGKGIIAEMNSSLVIQHSRFEKLNSVNLPLLENGAAILIQNSNLDTINSTFLK